VSAPLKLWHNDCEWVVAESPEDATKVMAAHHGNKVGDYDEFSTSWELWGEDRKLTIDEDGSKTVLTGAEWAARGRAYIGSTEY
jgi:hypothetical protein